MPTTACPPAAYTLKSSANVRCTVVLLAEEGGPGLSGPLGGSDAGAGWGEASETVARAVATAVATVAVARAAAVASSILDRCFGLLAMSQTSRNTTNLYGGIPGSNLNGKGDAADLHGEGGAFRLGITFFGCSILGFLIQTRVQQQLIIYVT